MNIYIQKPINNDFSSCNHFFPKDKRFPVFVQTNRITQIDINPKKKKINNKKRDNHTSRMRHIYHVSQHVRTHTYWPLKRMMSWFIASLYNDLQKVYKTFERCSSWEGSVRKRHKNVSDFVQILHWPYPRRVVIYGRNMSKDPWLICVGINNGFRMICASVERKMVCWICGSFLKQDSILQ